MVVLEADALTRAALLRAVAVGRASPEAVRSPTPDGTARSALGVQ